MKNPFNMQAPSFDADAINATIQRALASAGLDTPSGPMHGVTQTIRRALAAGRGVQAAPAAPAAQQFDRASVVDVAARLVAADNDDDNDSAAVPNREASVAPAQQPTGSFETRIFTNDAGSRAYKTYVPTAAAEAPRAMLVMLHGCTQSADDFAAGTQMNRLAEVHGFLVVYPEQAAHANTSKCWN